LYERDKVPQDKQGMTLRAYLVCEARKWCPTQNRALCSFHLK